MSPHVRNSFVCLAATVGALCLALLPSGTAQEPDTARAIKERIKEWQTLPELKPYAYIRGEPATLALEPEKADPAQAIAVCIGLNEVKAENYGGWHGYLEACETDANDMAALLRQAGFAKPKVLLSKEATSEAVFKAIDAAADDINPGGIFVITYSGHGGQVDDLNGDEKDKFDETWCLYDRQVTDDELYERWARFKKEGVRIVVVSDSCHSGTVTKGVVPEHARDLSSSERLSKSIKQPAKLDLELRQLTEKKNINDVKDIHTHVRAMPHTVRIELMKNPELKKLHVKTDVPTPKQSQEKTIATVVLLAGCTDKEVSLEAGGNGLFTRALKETWDNGRFPKPYRSFLAAIKANIEGEQTPQYNRVGPANTKFLRQRPFTTKAP